MTPDIPPSRAIRYTCIRSAALTEETAAAVGRIAKREGASVSAVLRHAVEEFIRREEGEE